MSYISNSIMPIKHVKGFVRRLSKGELGHRRAWLLAKREDRPIERITHGPIARMAVSR